MRALAVLLAGCFVLAAQADPPPPKPDPTKVEVLKVVPKKVDPNEKWYDEKEPNDGWKLTVKVTPAKKK